MGRSPAQRRGSGQALGHLGATTVAGTPAGGGHDEAAGHEHEQVEAVGHGQRALGAQGAAQ